MNLKIIGILMLFLTPFATQAGGLMRCEASGKTVEYVQKQLQGYRCVAIKDAPPPPSHPYIPKTKDTELVMEKPNHYPSVFNDNPMVGMPIPPALLPSNNVTETPPLLNSIILPPKNLPLPSEKN